MVMSGWSVKLSTLFQGRLRPPKRFTSISPVTDTTLLESAEGETNICGRTGWRTRNLWFLSQTRYLLHYAARLRYMCTMVDIRGDRQWLHRSKVFQTDDFFILYPQGNRTQFKTSDDRFVVNLDKTFQGLT